MPVAAAERALGELVAEKYGTDFYFLDRFPSAIRPFYTMPCPDDARYSNSYDLFLRGQEICSGAQRCHEPELLERILAEKGVDAAPLEAYISSFRHGAAPHGLHAAVHGESTGQALLGQTNVLHQHLLSKAHRKMTREQENGPARVQLSDVLGTLAE